MPARRATDLGELEAPLLVVTVDEPRDESGGDGGACSREGRARAPDIDRQPYEARPTDADVGGEPSIAVRSLITATKCCRRTCSVRVPHVQLLHDHTS